MIANIKRPPFDFKTDSRLVDAINNLVDAIENDEQPWVIASLEDIVYGCSRTLPEGSEAEAFVVNYYCDGGWQHGR
jgi:hypothetical protein